MARSDAVTLLSLDRYAQIMNIPLTHFNQLGGTKAPVVTCNDKKSIWDQNDRDTLAWTMIQAEEMIAEYLNFWPSPKFLTDEEIAFELPGVRRDWEWGEVQTRYGMIECFGTELLTEVELGAAVTYSISNNNPNERENLATITNTLYGSELTACDDKCEVAVFFREEDEAEDPADCRWEIKPLKVDIDGTSMSITGESSLFVKPELWDLTRQDSVGSNADDAWIIDFDIANLVTQVDVYCRTVNKQSPITLQWDGVCDCVGACEHRTQTACAYRTDKRRGSFAPRPSTWNGTTNITARPLHCHFPPESVLANYRAGYALNKSCRMNGNMERAIVKLTNALMPEPPCGFCGDVANRTWQDDRREIDPLTQEAGSMPWDIYKRGALEAWRIVKLFALGRGSKMGRGYR